MDVFIQFALAAAQFAVDDARLTVTPEIADRVGVYIASGIGGFQTIERRAQGADQGRPAAHLSVFHTCIHHQSRRRSGFDPLQRSRPEPRHLHRVHRLGARDRRGVRDHPPRRRRHHDCRRLRGGDHADGRRRVRRDAGAVDPQRRAGNAPAVPSTRIATASSWARAPGICHPRGRSSRRSGAARRSTRELVGYGLTSDAYHLTGQPEDAHGAIRSMTMALRKARHRAAAGRLHQRARHLDADQRSRPKRSASSGCSASTPTSWRCRRPSR